MHAHVNTHTRSYTRVHARVRDAHERGGKMRWPFAVALVVLWLIYILISALNDYDHLNF